MGVTVLPVSFVHKHAKLSKCKLQAYYLDHSCCARPPGPAANRWTVRWQGGADRFQISRKTISIDLAKSAETDATHSQLWQSVDPPLGSDLHYDDK